MQTSRMGELMFWQFHERYPNDVPELPMPQMRTSAPVLVDAEADVEISFTMAPISDMMIEYAAHPDNQGGEMSWLGWLRACC